MQALVNYSDKEIAWHGLVNKIDDMHYYIYDILVYPQTVTSATVESDDDLYAIWLDELDDDTFNSVRMQGHSHVNMGITPSGTDDDYYTTLIEHISDYFIFIIMNKSGKVWANLYDVANNLVYEADDIKLTKDGVDYGAWYKEQYNEHVTQKTYATTYSKPTMVAAKSTEAKDYDDYYYDRMYGRRKGKY